MVDSLNTGALWECKIVITIYTMNIHSSGITSTLHTRKVTANLLAMHCAVAKTTTAVMMMPLYALVRFSFSCSTRSLTTSSTWRPKAMRSGSYLSCTQLRGSSLMLSFALCPDSRPLLHNFLITRYLMDCVHSCNDTEQ